MQPFSGTTVKLQSRNVTDRDGACTCSSSQGISMVSPLGPTLCLGKMPSKSPLRSIEDCPPIKQRVLRVENRGIRLYMQTVVDISLG